MFTEISNLSTLVIYLNPTGFGYNFDWKSISERILCIFIVKDEDDELISKVSDKSLFFVDKHPSFGLSSTLKRAVTAHQIDPNSFAFLTNDLELMKSVINEPIGTILIHPKRLPFEYHGHTPDFIIQSHADLKKVISNEVKGFFSEVCMTYLRENVVYGNTGFYFKTTLPKGPEDCDVFIMGRYYDPGHSKNNLHQLSHRIRISKQNESQDNLFASLFKPFILNIIDDADGVTRVPPRPSKQRDRLKPIVEYCVKNTKLENMCSSLVCVREYSDHKSLGREDRYANVKGAFKANKNVQNKHIVLIDDVLSTGATVSECANALLQSGAKKVSILILASHQFTPSWSSREQLPCPKEDCDGTLILKIKKDNTFFYGCSNYHSTDCKGSYDFLKGWNKLRFLNTIDDDDDDFDFNF